MADMGLPSSGVAGEIVEGARCLQTRIEDLEHENRKLREIEEAAREVVKEHDAEFGEEPWASDPDPYDQAIDSLRTALEADTGGQGE